MLLYLSKSGVTFSGNKVITEQSTFTCNEVRFLLLLLRYFAGPATALQVIGGVISWQQRSVYNVDNAAGSITGSLSWCCECCDATAWVAAGLHSCHRKAGLVGLYWQHAVLHPSECMHGVHSGLHCSQWLSERHWLHCVATLEKHNVGHGTDWPLAGSITGSQSWCCECCDQCDATAWAATVSTAVIATTDKG